MKAGIIGRHVACLAQHRLRLRLASIVNKHTGANGASIALRSFQPNLDPMILLWERRCGEAMAARADS